MSELFLPNLFTGLFQKGRNFGFAHTAFGKTLPDGGEDFIEGERPGRGCGAVDILVGKLAEIPFQGEAGRIGFLAEPPLCFGWQIDSDAWKSEEFS